MAEQVWTTGKLTPIYTPVGTNSDGSVRYRRAPFDLLQWASTPGGDAEVYVNTLGFQSTGAEDIGLLDDTDAITVSHEFGWYMLGRIVLEPHDGNGLDDTWASLNSFGYI